MKRIDHFNLRSFDLNLLLSFDALMQELSVTRAAACLKVGQPAMSHSLASLRLLFDDELFVRAGHRMEPTLRARALHPQIQALLKDAQQVVLSRDAFDPADSQQLFRIGITTQLESLLVAPLVAELSHSAPGLRLLVSHTSRDSVFEALEQETLDMAIGYLPGGASWHQRAHLLETEHLCCFHPRQLPLNLPVSRKAYEQARHALISSKPGMLGYLEENFAVAGMDLKVSLAAPNFLTLLSAIATAPMIATLPARVAQHYGPMFGLAVSPVPIRIPPLPIELIWHARSTQDPASVWMRGRILAAAAQARSGPTASAARKATRR